MKFTQFKTVVFDKILSMNLPSYQQKKLINFLDDIIRDIQGEFVSREKYNNRADLVCKLEEQIKKLKEEKAVLETCQNILKKHKISFKPRFRR